MTDGDRSVRGPRSRSARTEPKSQEASAVRTFLTVILLTIPVLEFQTLSITPLPGPPTAMVETTPDDSVAEAASVLRATLLRPVDPSESLRIDGDTNVGPPVVDGDVLPARPTVPVSISVPAAGVVAPILPVGLKPSGEMEVPADVSTVGWYDPIEGAGVIPGEAGTAVLAGHVASRVQGRGASTRCVTSP